MKNITAEQRLAFVRQDVARLLEELPTNVLITPIEGFENLEVVLHNIQIACDEEDKEPLHWLVTWYEVFMYDDEEGTHTLATFDTEKQVKDFIYDYSMRYPEVELYYDEWQSNADGSGVAKRNPIN
jgi:hypothetical protein